ncbi:hypothetical protein [Amycolatopsis sp. NPDC059021]|uniref:hypothetical protein n=1 Tax=Amycolatopsis sp. NPDC059021 TaxID=3346704 RepID=UPI00366C3DA7
MGLFDGLAHLGESVLDKVKGGGKTLARLAEGTAGWVDDLFKGDLGTQAVPAPKVIEQVINGNSADWFRGVDLARKLSEAQGEFTSRTSLILSGLESSWTGSASDAAQARIRKFRDVAIDADVTFKGNSRSLATVGHGFTRAQTSMEPLPNRPDKSFFDVVTPWKTDTEKAIDKYNKAVDRNLAIYREYTEQTRAGSAQLSIDYGQLGAYDGGAITASGSGGSGGREDAGEGNRHAVPPRQQRQAAGDSIAPASTSLPSTRSERGPGGQPGSGRRQLSFPHGRDDDTKAAGVVPPGFRSGLPGSDFPAPSSGGGGSSASGGSSGSGFLGGVAGAGGNGRGTRLGGSSGRSGFGAGTGKQTGSVPGGVNGRGGVGAAGNAGTAGSGGPAGIAPGGGARSGRGGERERERRFVLDDSLFTEGERADEVDPTTGLPPVPPTIGA